MLCHEATMAAATGPSFRRRPTLCRRQENTIHSSEQPFSVAKALPPHGRQARTGQQFYLFHHAI
jgi:hypothetical protein